jgi:hypothetical protein
VKRSALAILAGIAVTASPPAEAGRALIPASAAFEDGLLFGDNGPTVFLPDHRRGYSADWLKFETDVCGMLERVDSRRSVLVRSGLSDLYDFDEDDPAIEARTIIGQWISTHSEIAVVSDGVERSCDDYQFDGEGFPPETIARWPGRAIRATSYIA